MKYVHRIIFWLLLASSLIWGNYALEGNPIVLALSFDVFGLLKLTYLLGFTVVFWPIAYIELCDLVASRAGYNGKLYEKYFRSIKKDIAVSGGSALLLFGIYWTDAVSYDFSSIDIGFVGVPFSLASIYALFQMTKVKIGGTPVRKGPLAVTGILLAGFIGVSLYVLRENASGAFEPYQAIWFQITIMLASFYAFTSTALQLHFLQSGRIEASGFKSYFFAEVIRSRLGLYAALKVPIQKFNRRSRLLRAQYAANLRKKRKR